MRRWSVAVADPATMRRLGRTAGRTAQPGDVLLLVGPIGAGKTTLASGVLEGLGVPPPHPSPTFVLVRPYRGRLPAWHVDLYRLGPSAAEQAQLDLDEVLDGSSVAVVEWADYLQPPLPDGLCLRIAVASGPRRCRWHALGPAGRAWLERIVGAWSTEEGVS